MAPIFTKLDTNNPGGGFKLVKRKWNNFLEREIIAKNTFLGKG
jgi:hypothetical protein